MKEVNNKVPFNFIPSCYTQPIPNYNNHNLYYHNIHNTYANFFTQPTQQRFNVSYESTFSISPRQPSSPDAPKRKLDTRMSLSFILNDDAETEEMQKEPQETLKKRKNRSLGQINDGFKRLILQMAQAEGILVTTSPCRRDNKQQTKEKEKDKDKKDEEGEDSEDSSSEKKTRPEITVFLPERKRRRRVTPPQKRVLECAFAVNPQATPKERRFIAKKLGLSPRQVSTW